MNSKRPKETIPIEEVPNGAAAAKYKARLFLSNAELLADNPENANVAALLTIQALEEIGKADILENRLEEAQNRGDTFIQIDGRGDSFYSHPAKINAALNGMPQELRTLTMGTFDPSQQFFQTGKMEISQDLKEYIAYTEYKNGAWVSPHTVNPDEIKRLIQNLKGFL